MTPTCLSCVAIGVGEWVDQFYRMLKLVPWWQWMPTYRRDGRQTGRSTHGMIEAIALAYENCIPRITVSSPHGRFGSHLLHKQTTHFTKLLGIPVEVMVYQRGLIPCVHYVDHSTPVIMEGLYG